MKPRRAHVALVLALALCASGCARLFDHYDVGPTGLARADERLRRLIADDADSTALAAAFSDADALPSDPLLASLYGGILAYHAGAYRHSAALLDSATLIIDERETRSASRSVLSIISTDRVLPYRTGTTERLLLHYYAALAWLRLGSAEDAAVEARRLSLLLERTAPDDQAQQNLHATLRTVAAVIFELAGERNDANVAWRNVLALSKRGIDAGAGTSTGAIGNAHLPRPVPDSIDAWVIIERGFVGHRAEQAINLWLPGDEVGRLRGDDDSRYDMATLIAARITAAAAGEHNDYGALQVPLPTQAHESGVPGRATGHAACARQAEDGSGRASGVASGSAAPNATAPNGAATRGTASSGTTSGDSGSACSGREHDRDAPYLMHIAWPVFRDFTPPLGAAQVRVDSAVYAPVVRASVSSAVAQDLREDRPLLVARTVARAAAKLAITRGIEDELRENDDGAADLFALLGNITAVVTEQADTRSWTLLPGTIEVARVRVPAGARTLEVQANRRSVTVPLSPDGGAVQLLHVALQ